MSREFLELVPKELRGVWDTPEKPNPIETKFRVLNEEEKLKTKLRQTSNLYKHILGENMFNMGMMVADGSLNFDIRIINFKSLVSDIHRETQKYELLSSVATSLPEGKVNVDPNLFKETEVPAGLQGKTFLKYDTEKVNGFFLETIKALREARSDIFKKFGRFQYQAMATEYDQPYALFTGTVAQGLEDVYRYLDRDERGMGEGIINMLSAISQQPTPINSNHYFRLVIKKTVLTASIKNINWRQVYA